MLLITILSLIGVHGGVAIVMLIMMLMLMLRLSPPLSVARLLAATLEGGRAHALALDFDAHRHLLMFQAELLLGGRKRVIV